MSSKPLANVPDEVLLEIMGHLIRSAANGPDAVITIDLNLDYNGSSQTSKFRVRTNFSLSPLHADSRMRQAFLTSLQRAEITLCLRSTEAAYNLPGVLSRPWLLATRLLVQEVPLTDQGFEYNRRREAAEPGVFYINQDTLPNLQAMLVSIKSGARSESSVTVNFPDYASITPLGVSCRVLSRLVREFMLFFGHELFQLLVHCPPEVNTWFPTMMISINIRIEPHYFLAGAPASLQPSRDRHHRVLVKQGNSYNRFWDLRHTLDTRNIPDAFMATQFDKLYMRMALNPQVARGERLMVWFVLKPSLDRRTGVSRLQLWFDSINTLEEALNRDTRRLLREPAHQLNVWNDSCGLLNPSLRLKQQGLKHGDEFIVSLKSEDEEEADRAVEDNRVRLRLWE